VSIVPSDVSTLGVWAQDLLDAASQAVATTVGGPIERAFVSAGPPALDCCPQLSVHVASLTVENTSPTTPVTAPGHRITTTGMIFLATLVVTVARCVPISEENRQIIVPPSPESLTRSAVEIDEDLWAIWNLVAELQLNGEIFGGRCKALYYDPPTPLATEGGCGGWVWNVRAAIDGYKPV
jgi:hypothetical protein